VGNTTEWAQREISKKGGGKNTVGRRDVNQKPKNSATLQRRESQASCKSYQDTGEGKPGELPDRRGGVRGQGDPKNYKAEKKR